MGGAGWRENDAFAQRVLVEFAAFLGLCDKGAHFGGTRKGSHYMSDTVEARTGDASGEFYSPEGGAYVSRDFVVVPRRDPRA